MTGTQEDQVARHHFIDSRQRNLCDTCDRWEGATVHFPSDPARLPDSRVDIAEPGLDAAWAEAEASLPDGYVLELYWAGKGTRYSVVPEGERYQAAAMPDISPGWGRISGAPGDTPAAALRNLAARLRETRS